MYTIEIRKQFENKNAWKNMEGPRKLWKGIRGQFNAFKNGK